MTLRQLSNFTYAYMHRDIGVGEEHLNSERPGGLSRFGPTDSEAMGFHLRSRRGLPYYILSRCSPILETMVESSHPPGTAPVKAEYV